MSEIADVLNAIKRLRERGERMALATVVATKGSTYRRPGARLLVPESGELVGSVSGGCFESDVQRVAKSVMEDGESRLVDFDVTSDDEAVWGWGLGCKGAIDVFVEPAEQAFDISSSLGSALQEGRAVGAVTVLESSVPGVEVGARVLVHPDDSREQGLGDRAADEAAAEAVLAAFEREVSEKRELAVGDGSINAFVEVLRPPFRLLVCGAGLDSIPLVRFAAALDWRVEVMDDRQQLLNHDRYPEAWGFLPVENAAEAASKARVDDRTYVVVMTHNYLRDIDYLRSFLGSDVAYIGMLGPRYRLERLLDELAQEGVRPSQEDLAKIHGPAGLDLGAEGPDEIAWGIMGELLAVREGRNAGFLREREGPIHPRTEAAPAVGGR